MGTADEPAITLQSVHHYFKEVSGNVLVRPAWFYDVEQQGEGMVDVATHLVDLVNWQCFPDEIIDYESDIAITSASHWPTVLTLDDFSRSTRLNAFPDFLQRYLNDSKLEVFGNGKINYQVKGSMYRLPSSGISRRHRAGETPTMVLSRVLTRLSRSCRMVPWIISSSCLS